VDPMNQIQEFLNSALDRSPRMLYYILRSKLLKSKSLENFDDQHPCLFVLSTGRVGTETLANLFALEKSMFSYHELHPKLFSLSKLSYDMADKYAIDKSIKKVFQAGFMTSREELLNYSLFCDRGYIETSPQCTFLAQIILDSIPNVKFIHLVRNPLDVVRSGMRRGWYDGHAFDSMRITPLLGTKFDKLWKSFDPFHKNLWLWAETNRWILEFSKNLSSDNYLQIKSESIFQKDMTTISQLYKYINKTTPAERRIESVINKKINMQRTGEFQFPVNFKESLEENLSCFVKLTSKEINYEFD
jgi:hypothetical protein